MTPIEIIALIVIIVGVLKLVVLAINPKSWMSMAKGFWANKILASIVSLILAIVVLYYLLQGGFTIIDILAVTAFVALLMAVGLAGEIPALMKKYESRMKSGGLWKQYWFYVLLWIILMLWGVKELFM